MLLEAIQRARETDVLGPLRIAVDQLGYRRRLLARFASWIRLERRPDGPPPGAGPGEAAQWALFRLFSETLNDIQARTPEAWAVWASRLLAENPPVGWRNLDATLVVVVEPLDPCPAVRRVLEFFHQRTGGLIVTLPFDPEPALGELYAAVEPTRRYFLGLGVAEQTVPVRPAAPPGLTELDRELFRTDAYLRPKLSGTGLEILGGPRGEGVALLIARRVRAAIDQGYRPDEVLILVPREDDDVSPIRATLASWGIPVAPGPTARLATTPAVAALRLVIRLPVEGWEVATLTRLLRNGAVDWSKLGLSDPFRRFEAAAAIHATRVYRNLAQLRGALDRAVAETKKGSIASPAQHSARDVIDELAKQLGLAASRPAPYRTQLGRLQSLAKNLGLDQNQLAPLWDAIDEHAWVLDQVGPAIAAIPIPWADFVARVEAIIAEAEPLPVAALDQAGAVRVEVVGAVDAARSPVVVVANLTEKTFPSPGSIPLNPTRSVEPEPRPDPQLPLPLDLDDPETTRPTDLGYAREMLRFSRALAAADDELILVYPTTDLTGEGLLPAGFLDEILRRLDPEAKKSQVETHARFDPVLRGHEALAVAPGDARVLAVAHACDGDHASLRALARSPDHADALWGVAEAFRVGHARRDRFDFNAHDGWLMDGDAVAQVAAKFDTEHPFSPSQIESYAFCPFQFFQRYVLGLKSSDPFEELAEDYAGRGKDVHDILETAHIAIQAEGSADLATLLPIHINTAMAARLESFDRDVPPGEADVAEVLREINTRRSGKALERYVKQAQVYAAKLGVGAVPTQFEVKFGQPDKVGSLEHLKLGDGDEAIQLQGVIDRIDLIAADGETRFRIIDYKTGSNPTPAEVKSGLASQLPLYAMAVEELVLKGDQTPFHDSGYWSLPKDGYKSVKLGDWPDYRARMIGFVLAMVAELRRGVFPVFSQEKTCTQRCDFSKTCRVGEVRTARKAWNDRPSLEPES